MIRPFVTRLARAALAALLACGAMAHAQPATAPLRVCADPDNLPFSKDSGAERGLYVELAELVGQRLKREVRFDWWLSFNQRRALRNTIAKDSCDAYFALPAAADYRVRALARTRPFLTLNYALIAPASLDVTRPGDLRRVRLGVQFGTPPHLWAAAGDGYRYITLRDLDEVLQALARGEVDAALLYGPAAGYAIARHHADRQPPWRITPLAGPDGFEGQVAVAVRRDEPELLREIDAALEALAPQIDALARKYGFPQGTPLKLMRADAPASTAGRIAVPRGMGVYAQAAPSSDAAVAPPCGDASQAVAADMAALAPLGRQKFNDICSHCHGTDGASPLRERDLRRLQRRYADDWPATAQTTILQGRTDAGMPTWKGVLSDAEIAQILAFLRTIQK
jgi:ABC-type amino acid transport substrate-binding protein/cytochrome c5